MNRSSALIALSIALLALAVFLGGSRLPLRAEGFTLEGDRVTTFGAALAPAITITVDSTIDAVDAVPGNGVCATAGSVCTLRAAIQEANALAGDNTITVPGGTYTLTIAGTGEDAA